MKKTRVYELAKEFRKDTRELLDLLHEMDIEAVSHASSLPEDQAERVRERLRAAQTHQIIQKRISSGVIRRRRKEIKPKPELEPAPPAASEAPAEAISEAAPPPAVEEAPPPLELEPVVEAPTPKEEKPTPLEPEAAEDMPKVRKPRWAARSERARIISKPSITPAETDIDLDLEPPAAPPKEAPPPPKEAEAGRRRKGRAEPGRRRGKKRDVSRAELYAPREGKFRPSKVKKSAKAALKTQITQPKAIKMRIKMAEAISVAELAKRMGVKAPEVIKQLISLGMMVTLNQIIDLEAAAIVAAEFGYEIERSAFEESELIKPRKDKPEDLRPRPPVVTIMGHVDHGKSSLLEALSTHNLKIVDGEAGGITQHIGAYKVKADGGPIVFLDTPGHEAFTAMRARGAQVTDIVVLVVAADDGVMDQTREAINHARAAEVPIIVAVNKMDKLNIDPERVKRELSELGLAPEDWGGETLFVFVSAKTGLGLDDLLEAIRLQAEILELKANPDKLALGRIVEAQLDRGRGAVATVLVQNGTLRVGDAFVVGAQYGKVRALFNDLGQAVDEASPSDPVLVQGLSGVPEAGDEFLVVDDERTARQVSAHRQAKRRETELSQTTRLSLESFMEQAEVGEAKELNIVIKADVQGSIEALRDALEKLSTDKVKLSVIHSGVGAITESDIMLAAASEAVVVGFNVRANPKAAEVVEAERVEVRYYDVIYKAIEDIKEAMTGLLESIFKEHVLGQAEVREVFRVPRVGSVAGCYITDGNVRRGAPARLIRDGVVVYNGKVASLRRFKDDVREVAAGYECGVSLENFNDIKVGDLIEIYELEEIRPTLED